ncbi:MAG: DNA methyltransferase [Catonella sp.]|uniref:DNA methyltransferase n=1 Tax=Catonella sp. TaxID=2382125 RepID=UPI003F9ED962
MKADRNKTIDISVEEGREYLKRCISLTEKAGLSEILDKTILGNTLEILSLLPENTTHPTQKPEKLLAKLILASSNEGDVVPDPFLGSSSTSVTAKKLGRHYIGIEQNEQYCVGAEKRLYMAEADKTI